jgi:hypothetical protein
MDDRPVTRSELDAAKSEILDALEAVETKLLTAWCPKLDHNRASNQAKILPSPVADH